MLNKCRLLIGFSDCLNLCSRYGFFRCLSFSGFCLCFPPKLHNPIGLTLVNQEIAAYPQRYDHQKDQDYENISPHHLNQLHTNTLHLPPRLIRARCG